jgi:hypothetical protein
MVFNLITLADTSAYFRWQIKSDELRVAKKTTISGGFLSPRAPWVAFSPLHFRLLQDCLAALVKTGASLA